VKNPAVSSLAATLINWNALWKIAAAAFIGGAGVVVAFGVALLGLERARTARSDGMRLAHRALAGACGVLCIAAVAVGLYAMTDKPSSKTAPKAHPALPAAQVAHN
jgi:NADH:ubiquinone oxidoreductase subunit 6 (subunit J)